MAWHGYLARKWIGGSEEGWEWDGQSDEEGTDREWSVGWRMENDSCLPCLACPNHLSIHPSIHPSVCADNVNVIIDHWCVQVGKNKTRGSQACQPALACHTQRRLSCNDDGDDENSSNASQHIRLPL